MDPSLKEVVNGMELLILMLEKHQLRIQKALPTSMSAQLVKEKAVKQQQPMVEIMKAAAQSYATLIPIVLDLITQRKT
jgi:hypothetical protein